MDINEISDTLAARGLWDIRVRVVTKERRRYDESDLPREWVVGWVVRWDETGVLLRRDNDEFLHIPMQQIAFTRVFPTDRVERTLAT